MHLCQVGRLLLLSVHNIKILGESGSYPWLLSDIWVLEPLSEAILEPLEYLESAEAVLTNAHNSEGFREIFCLTHVHQLCMDLRSITLYYTCCPHQVRFRSHSQPTLSGNHNHDTLKVCVNVCHAGCPPPMSVPSRTIRRRRN